MNLKGSVVDLHNFPDLHIFANPGSQNIAEPTHPDPHPKQRTPGPFNFKFKISILFNVPKDAD